VVFGKYVRQRGKKNLAKKANVTRKKPGKLDRIVRERVRIPKTLNW